MKILVSDTSVLIDLERGGFLDSCFRLPFEFAVPDLLYARELADFGGPELVARGLRVEELTSAEVTTAQAVWGTHSKLSLPDAFAYVLACARGWTLLTGDGELRALAEAGGIEFFGVNCNPAQASWTTSPKIYSHVYVDDAAAGCPLRENPR